MPIQLNPNAVRTSRENLNKSLSAYEASQQRQRDSMIDEFATALQIPREQVMPLLDIALNSTPMGMTRGVKVGESLEKGGAWNMFKRPDIEREAATYYDLSAPLGMKAELAGMTPNEYLQAVAEGFAKNNPKYTPQQIMEMIMRQKAPNAGYYVENQASSLPFLEYGQKFSQEGIHRAIAAKQRGVQEMPVMLLYEDGRLPF